MGWAGVGVGSVRALTRVLSPLPSDPAAKPTKRPVVLITTVDIGGGKSDKIELRKGDEPADAAREFCTKHKLPPSIIGPLTQHILENMAKAKQTAEAQKVGVKGVWGLGGLLHAAGQGGVALCLLMTSRWLLCHCSRCYTCCPANQCAGCSPERHQG